MEKIIHHFFPILPGSGEFMVGEHRRQHRKELFPYKSWLLLPQIEIELKAVVEGNEC